MKQHYSFSIRLLVLFLVLIFASLAGFLWWKDGTAAVDISDKTPVTFVIKPGEGVRTIIANLSAKKLIRSPTSFFILVKLLKIDDQIQAGDFRLHRAMGAYDVANELTHGVQDVWVTIPEGWRSNEIATRLAKDLDIPEQEFLKYAKEGYMFPDTYLIPRVITAQNVAQLLNDTFDKKITDQMREDLKKTGLSFEETVILASIVEREGRSDQDRPIIAGILLNRLNADWPLQTDATIQYALGYQSTEKTWWKKHLTQDDLKIKSPYNTYLNPGLPPAPIANPGIAAIHAAIYPQQTDYWFYLHDPQGGVHYAKTIEEHNANIAVYLQ